MWPIIRMLIIFLLSACSPCVCFSGTAHNVQKEKGYYIVKYNGAPTLFHNGVPMYANLYANLTWSPKEIVAEHAEKMIQSGIHIFIISVSMDWGNEPSLMGVSSYSNLDQRIRAILKIDPSAKFLLRVHGWVPRSWYQDYPAELMAGRDGRIVELPPKDARAPNSFASPLWKEEIGGKLIDLIKYVKSEKYYDSVIGLMFMTGIEGQWTWWGLGVQAMNIGEKKETLVTIDYSPAMKNYFREWVKKKYGNNIDALRKSWDNNSVTFADIEPPMEDIAKETDFYFFKIPDKGTTRYVKDYFCAYADCRIEALLYWGKLLKQETKDSPWLYGAFAGAILNTFVGGGQNYLRNIDLSEKICHSPYVDFVASPAFRKVREVGEITLAPMLIDSFLLHNKFFFMECDQTTHLNTHNLIVDTAESGKSNTPQNLEGSLAKLKRIFCYVLCKGRMGIWWWDQGLHPGVRKHKGVQNKAIWYGDPAIENFFSCISKIADDSIHYDCSSASEIAVLFSEETPFYTSPSPLGIGRDLIVKQVKAFGKIGAPFDIFAIEDIKNIPQYKLYIFWNTFYINDELRTVIKEKIERNGSTVLWLYAPGFLTEKTLSPENITELTGIKTGMILQNIQLKQKTVISDHPIIKDLGARNIGVMNKPMEAGTVQVDSVCPFFYCDDQAAVILARNEFNNKSTMSIKKFQDWTSIYATFYPIDGEILRNIAINAGVHIYSDNKDDVIYANKSFLAIHSINKGRRTIRLPYNADVYDMFEDKLVARNTKIFTFDFMKPDTKLFKIEAKEILNPWWKRMLWWF
ncbi:MAG: hypothetical protein A2020_02475 [Lentisphaerae bacterium GWF2_45_14]|nr:MAG: hypothetical protein A2020_02475 [Lentisphaerae bacterium GWF2_45_14]